MSAAKSIRILYMEDDPGLARLCQKKLERAGYMVDLARNGEEGLAMYAAGSYDVVAVDQTMPILDGLEVIRILVAQGPLPPVIMVTGTGSERVAVEAMKLGARDYIVKDVAGGYLELLPTVIEAVLQQHRLVEGQRRAEAALRESEARYRTIFETTGTATVIVEKDTTISLANAEFERLSGFSKEELEGKRNWAEFVAQDDREMLVQDHRLREVEPDVAPRHYEFQFTDRAGEIRDVFLTMALIPGTNQRVASFLDITKRKRAEEALREANRKIERLHEAAHRLEASNTEDELFRLTIEAAERILEFTMCQLGVVEESTLVTKAVSTGLPAEIRATMNLEAGLAREAHHTGKTHVCGNLAEAPQTQPARECFGSMITAPIGALGVFQVVSAEPNAFTEYDARLLELLLGHTAEALKRIRLQDKLQEQIIHDPLTGIYNRRYFNQMVETELQRSRRYRHSIGFLMIDVNRFKEINDNYGHQVGDRVLQAMGELFLDSVRASDIVVRYGGDEFLIMFTETNGEIDIVAQRIREAVARWNEDSSPIDFPVTLAMGASYWLPEAGEPLETVLQEADRRMYEDKRKQAATG